MDRVRFNFGAAVGLNTLYLAGSLFGLLPPGGSAVLHNLTTLGVCVNAMRPVSAASRDKLWILSRRMSYGRMYSQYCSRKNQGSA